MPTPVEPDPIAAIAQFVATNEPTNDESSEPVPWEVPAILSNAMRDGKLWASRRHHTPQSCDLDGQIVEDSRSRYFVMAQNENSDLLVKKIRDNGDTYGQNLVRSRKEITVVQSTVKTPATTQVEPKQSRTNAQVALNANDDKPATNPDNVEPRVLPTVPNGVTHLVLVDKDGARMRWTNGADASFYIKGQAACQILDGSHKRLSPRIENGELTIDFF